MSKTERLTTGTGRRPKGNLPQNIVAERHRLVCVRENNDPWARKIPHTRVTDPNVATRMIETELNSRALRCPNFGDCSSVDCHTFVLHLIWSFAVVIFCIVWSPLTNYHSSHILPTSCNWITTKSTAHETQPRMEEEYQRNKKSSEIRPISTKQING